MLRKIFTPIKSLDWIFDNFIPIKSLDWILDNNCSMSYIAGKWVYYWYGDFKTGYEVKVRKDVNDAYNKGYEKGFYKGFDKALKGAEEHYGEV